MNTMTTGQLAAALSAGEYAAPESWRRISAKRAQDRIRKAVSMGHLISCGKIGIYNLFEQEAIQEWVNGGCKIATAKVNEEAGE